MDRTAAFYSQPTYVQRGGGALPIYAGSRRQRGGSLLGALKSLAMPFVNTIKQNAIRHAKQQAFGLAKDMAFDAFRGRNLGDSLKRHGIRRAKQLGKNVVFDTISTATDPIKRKSKAAANTISRKRKAATNTIKRTFKRRRKSVKNF